MPVASLLIMEMRRRLLPVLPLAFVVGAMLAAPLTSTVAFAAHAERSQVLIACGHEGTFSYYSAPRRCELYARIDRDQRAKDVRGVNLVWRGWGEPAARASGRYELGGPLSVVAFGRTDCGERSKASYYRFANLLRKGKAPLKLRLAICGEKKLPGTLR